MQPGQRCRRMAVALRRDLVGLIENAEGDIDLIGQAVEPGCERRAAGWTVPAPHARRQ